MNDGPAKVESHDSAPQGDAQRCFARSFEEAYRVLWCVAAGIVGNAATADDVVQDAALTGLNKYDQFRDVARAKVACNGSGSPDDLPAFTAWMSQIVRYVALNQYRKDRRHAALSLSDTENDPIPMTLHGRGETHKAPLTRRGQLTEHQQAFDDRMMSALERVGDEARACLLLRTLEGLDYRRISQLLDIPQGTAMSHVHRTRQFLRQQLADLTPPPTDSTSSNRSHKTTP